MLLNDFIKLLVLCPDFFQSTLPTNDPTFVT